MRETAIRPFFVVAVALLACAALPAVAQASRIQGFETGDPIVFSIGDAGKQASYQTESAPEGSMQFLITTVGETSNEDGVGSQSGNFAVGNVTLQNFFNNISLAGNEGSGVLIPFTVSAGQTELVFQYDFLSNEQFQSLPRPDFAFAAIFDSSNSLQGSVNNFVNTSTPAGLFDGQIPFNFHTGYQTLSLSLASLAPGAYTLGVGVEDAQTADHASGLLIDNVQVVPEPSVCGLAIAGAVLLACLRRRVKRV